MFGLVGQHMVRVLSTFGMVALHVRGSCLFLVWALFTFGLACLHLATVLSTCGLVALHLAWILSICRRGIVSFWLRLLTFG